MMYGYGFGNMYNYLGWFGMFLMMLIPLAIVAGIIYLVNQAVVKGGGNSRPGAGPQDPVEILKMRYARGEITRDEFNRIREDLAND